MNIRDLILNIINEHKYIPMTIEKFYKFFNADKYTMKSIRNIIRDLEKDNLIRISSKGKIVALTINEKSLIGKISMAQGGYGFFISDNEDYEDVFISARNLNTAQNNDKVKIKIIKDKEEGKNAEGEVVEIIERNLTEIVGTYQSNKGYGFVVADDKNIFQDIYIDKKYSKNANNNDKVIVNIIKYPKDGSPEGRVTEILGNINDRNIDILSLIRLHKIPDEFSKKTKKELLYIPNQVEQEEKHKRTDFRELFTVTIDGRDSKDFDDAISIEKSEENYELYVHIADVAHYVKKNSEIDKDAYARGNSTYLYNIVIPMLPEELSNGICSLNPLVERLAVSLKMTIDKIGKVIDSQFYESVIKSDYRLVYDDVNSFIDNNDKVYDDEILEEKLLLFNELYKILNNRRQNRGSIDFDFTESQIDVTEEGGVLNISTLQRGSGNKMIEEFMLCANETVATLFAYMDFPFIYRIHENPKIEKVDTFKKVLNTMGYNIRGNELYPKDFQTILNEVKGKDIESLVNILMLRTMQKAKYSEKRDIHFGLSLEYYTHFTSPIRRYPDLIVHRLLKDFINNKLSRYNVTTLEENISNYAQHLSITERRSEECERDVEDLMKCKYMRRYIGDEFNGRISSITEFGMFIELYNTVEGLFMYKFVNDRYEYYEDKLECINTNNNKKYKIGQEVRILVRNVDIDQRNIDFELVEENDESISK